MLTTTSYGAPYKTLVSHPENSLYSLIRNYTCATMAIDILSKAGISTPNGS